MARADQSQLYVNPYALRPIVVTWQAVALICSSILISGCMVSGAILLRGAPQALPPLRVVMLVTPTPLALIPSPTRTAEGRVTDPPLPSATVFPSSTSTVLPTNTLSGSWERATLTAQVTPSFTPSRLPSALDSPHPLTPSPTNGEGEILIPTLHGIFQTATALAMATPTQEVRIGYHQARVAVEKGLYTYWCFPPTPECKTVEGYWLPFGEGDTFVTLADEDFCAFDDKRQIWFFQSNLGTWFAWKDANWLYSEPSADIEEECRQ